MPLVWPCYLLFVSFFNFTQVLPSHITRLACLCIIHHQHLRTQVGLYTLKVEHSDHIQIHIIDGVSTVASNLCERKEIVHGHGCQ